MNNKNPDIVAADLFCGAGGLTYGLESAGVKVKLGIDIDPNCAHPIERNTHAIFIESDIAQLAIDEIGREFTRAQVSLLAGCAPCQPFSTYSRAAKQKYGNYSEKGKRKKDWQLLESFIEIIQNIQPELITMENVPPLALQDIFKRFVHSLKNYWLDWKIIECQSIGLPQTRKRLVLVASKLGPINIPNFNHPLATVKSTIGGLPPIRAGSHSPYDRLHKASRLSPTNLKRIRHSIPGGTWRDWPISLRSDCHLRDTGATYPSVYGRMEWDFPAPTITTQCFGYGNGRFGHPEQDRAISLREAAMLQGFPRHYSFVPEDQPINFATIGRLIGNAVPVTLGRVIGELLLDHAKDHS